MANVSDNLMYEIYDRNTFSMSVVFAWMAVIEYLRQLNGLPYVRFHKIYNYYISPRRDMEETRTLGVSFRSTYDQLLGKNKRHVKINIPSNMQNNLLMQHLASNVDVFRFILSIQRSPIMVVAKFPKSQFCTDKFSIFGQVNTPETIKYAVCVIAYDDRERTFMFQNSCGSDWHMGGFGIFTYEFMPQIVSAVTICQNLSKSDDCETKDEDRRYMDFLQNVIQNPADGSDLSPSKSKMKNRPKSPIK